VPSCINLTNRLVVGKNVVHGAESRQPQKPVPFSMTAFQTRKFCVVAVIAAVSNVWWSLLTSAVPSRIAGVFDEQDAYRRNYSAIPW
jgi:hypothetical protein